MPSSKANTFEEAFNLLHSDGSKENFFYDYYVQRRDPSVEELKSRILFHMRQSSGHKFLFSGSRGTGKTTELQNLKYVFEKEGFLVVFVSAIEVLNIADLYYTDVILAIMRKTLEAISNEKIELEAHITQDIEELFKQILGESRDIITNEQIEQWQISLLSILIKIELKFSGDYRAKVGIRERASHNITIIIDKFNDLLRIINRKILFIIDDLERVTEHRKISEILYRYSFAFERLKCSIIFVVPPSLLYYPESIRSRYDKYFLLPFRVHDQDENGDERHPSLMEAIVRKRIANENLVPPNIISLCASYSGGIITEFIKLLKDCCKTAMDRKLVTVNEEKIADNAFNKLVNTYRVAISGRHYTKLIEVYNKKDTDNPDDDFKELLDLLAILEYRDYDGVYDIHPALHFFLKDKGLIK